MADTSTKVSGSITTEPSSMESVALHLMDKISLFEEHDGEKKDRKYWLSLYRQCYKATKGYGLKDILNTES